MDGWQHPQQPVVLKTWAMESPHNYEDSKHENTVFLCPGATYFEVEFDERCETEKRYGCFCVLKLITRGMHQLAITYMIVYDIICIIYNRRHKALIKAKRTAKCPQWKISKGRTVATSHNASSLIKHLKTFETIY